ncbi:hypothetical protein [Sphingomonas sp. LM7]|uniref:hypothetical protein n=1 Tax=Sphingomonas sp. LM7 TaxID=1938607 RepID=UPI000983CFB5|nr:hypothetical protein [Sphingomonas sp. LM7]AQR75159.1 hypothetical protein BXU08_17175 [Sphingomonas sp. LM7]
MMFATLLALAAAQAGGGVAVDSVPQIGIATRHARCIVRQVGVAPAEEAARAAKVADAVKGCRAFVEGDFTQGRITVGDRPVNKRWWGRMQAILDSVEGDVSAAIVQPKQYKIIWELPEGGRVDAYNAPEPLTRITLLTVPL